MATRADVFFDDVDQHGFINTLAKACRNTSGPASGFCLANNHDHLGIALPNTQLAAGMAWRERLTNVLGAAAGCAPKI